MTVTFRDLLRSHPNAAREYAEAKRYLASKYAQDRSSYQQAKDKVVERILEGAGRSAPVPPTKAQRLPDSALP